jgi:hypothetical protein
MADAVSQPSVELKIQERLTCLLTPVRMKRTRLFEFDLTPRQAMTLMRSLQALQRRYRWPVPLVPELERLDRWDD